ncbi:uncharacterized protein LOC110451950 isoform X2 [Mizuhopecten yessoensis]|uniref:uncharacterized protein LOC110451950 isoform X2 n=1 Tax=Mizuhopecten yessoensis TaxID=6573 RepID=UPI000B45B01D|nr:uncharacterized protein LOC110451950 isoform X2 [Mizuhopecten yessoensis]
MATFVLDHQYNTDKVIPIGTSMMELFPHSTLIASRGETTVTTPNGVQIGPIRVPVANTYDVDNEYDNIMNKALRSYKLHRDKERADTRQKLLKTAYKKRWHVPHAPSRPVTPDRKPRPKSSLPPKMDAIKEVLEANTTNESYDSTEPKKPVDVKRVTLSMDAPSMSNSFMRRNQTSQAWYSHSCPSTSYLNSHMMRQYQSSGSASPSSSTSSKSYSGSGASTRASYSPQLKKKTESSPKKRPESAKTNYSYDGGIFVPNKPKHDYFVIHPDWVSEAMSIQKLSLKERRPVSRTGTWPGRRCKSAPPPKLRNPITWDVVHGVDHKY